MEEAVVLEHIPNPACKYCTSSHTVRYGLTPGRKNQRYLCHGCEKTFVDNHAPPGMQFPVHVIASALDLFYQDVASLHAIRRSLFQRYGVQPDHSNIRRWIIRFALQEKRAFGSVHPWVGDEWVVRETRVATHMPGSQPLWLWDILDTQTRFLLVTGLSRTRDLLNFSDVLALAIRRAGTNPEVMFADETIPVVGDFERRALIRSARRMCGLLQKRTLLLGRLASNRAIHAVVSGWAIHHNFFCSLPELGGKTPAEAAGVSTEFKSWADIVAMR